MLFSVGCAPRADNKLAMRRARKRGHYAVADYLESVIRSILLATKSGTKIER